MHISLLARAAVLAIALLSVLWLPWPLALLCMFFAGLVFPPAAFALGVLADLLYYPGSGFFWASAEGLVLALSSGAVRHFVKTRII